MKTNELNEKVGSFVTNILLKVLYILYFLYLWLFIFDKTDYRNKF
jgi:hypothetical protein